MRFKIFILVFITVGYILFPVHAIANSMSLKKGFLSGKVTDLVTGQPIFGATIYISDLKTGSSSGPDGNYSINNLPQTKLSVQVIIDLGQQRNFSKISTTFLQQYPSWIWLPVSVTYGVSKDTVNFEQIYFEKNDIGTEVPGSFIKSFAATFPESLSRYIKITAKNIAKCPAWHPGAGEKAWIFVDEVVVE